MGQPHLGLQPLPGQGPFHHRALPLGDDPVTGMLQGAAAAAFEMGAGRAHPVGHRCHDPRRGHPPLGHLALHLFAGQGQGHGHVARDALAAQVQPLDRQPHSAASPKRRNWPDCRAQ